MNLYLELRRWWNLRRWERRTGLKWPMGLSAIEVSYEHEQPGDPTSPIKKVIGLAVVVRADCCPVNRTFQLRKNRNPSNLQVTVPANWGGRFEDINATILLEAGDVIDTKVTIAGRVFVVEKVTE